MKKATFGLLIGLVSVSAYAQFDQILQSVKSQVSNAVQSQVSQGVHSATNDAIQSAQTQTHKIVDSVRTPSNSNETKGVQDAKP
ncbi:hypothetical protein WS67_12575 [Burkholderia singularis]|uniref:Uncharacterized protein n=1 Tax=Burkholderia singularis TaxID=1503053 RepID=A0A124P939_9BURK|nr:MULTISPECIES: hypothetical protein [Burkholderia]AOK29366.1 hypothetical protein AQ611_07910 [Burkholderia sp. Bp7605]KVE27319.1 hypothetical protein WS67_12575 [Burkholderia singularis]KVE33809.1 hypothetical protein WS68_11635 [Burkholderia sp. TSV86]SMF98893.1 hypothetical protein BSIN_2736 [Burkholderia singularis]